MNIEDKILEISNYPKKGITFYDVTPLLIDPKAFHETIHQLEKRYGEKKVEGIAVLESRGFIFGSALAYAMHLPLILIRKVGKLPRETIDITYEKEYGKDILSMHREDVQSGQKMVVVDDLIATGGSAEAAAKLIEKAGGEVIEVACIIEVSALKAKEKLSWPLFSLVNRL